MVKKDENKTIEENVEGNSIGSGAIATFDPLLTKQPVRRKLSDIIGDKALRKETKRDK